MYGSQGQPKATFDAKNSGKKFMGNKNKGNRSPQ